jgi:N-acetylmuramoyl-L-alanine amidase
MLGSIAMARMPSSLRFRALPAALAVVLAAGCAPAVKRPLPGYDAMRDSLNAVDPAGLAGRRIVIDPGHGGRFRGSMGVKGLAEADANLAVSLQLRDLLIARGARVLLTRDTDRDFLTAEDSTLRGDLSERVRIANAFEPDLFVSVHHNADAGGRHDVNETQTYYKLGDEGASLDVAQDVHRALVRNVGIETQNVFPGNYHVLRNCDAPGILTETSYITYPPVEQRLRLPEKQAIEAQALYLGIARYFSRPVPRIARFVTRDPASGAIDSVFADGPIVRAEIDGAWDRAELQVDGAAVPTIRRGSTLEWTPNRPLDSGRHRARLRVRRTGVGAARDQTLAFTIRRPASALALSTMPEQAPAAGGLIGIRTQVLDVAGGTQRDSLRIRSTATIGKRVLLDTLVVTRDGVAWAYATVPAASTGEPAIRVRTTLTSAPSLSDSVRMERDGNVWSGFVARMPESVPLTGAPGTEEPDRQVAWINRDGFATLSLADSNDIVPALAGHRWWGDGDPPAFTPIAGGALHGRRIVVDADGGGDNSGGMGQGGTRAAVLNLDVARALAAMLEAAGARVRMTRDADVALSELARVQISEAFNADRFLRIGHRREAPHIGHYFASGAGKAWAGRVAAACSTLGIPVVPTAENAQYPLQQTSCPALYAGLARIDDPASEERLLQPGSISRAAYALYLALAQEWPAAPFATVDSVEVRDGAGTALPGAAVRFGNAIQLETDPFGRVRFVRTEPGPLDVDARHGEIRVRRTLLDSDRGMVLTGPQDP